MGATALESRRVGTGPHEAGRTKSTFPAQWHTSCSSTEELLQGGAQQETSLLKSSGTAHQTRADGATGAFSEKRRSLYARHRWERRESRICEGVSRIAVTARLLFRCRPDPRDRPSCFDPRFSRSPLWSLVWWLPGSAPPFWTNISRVLPEQPGSTPVAAMTLRRVRPIVQPSWQVPTATSPPSFPPAMRIGPSRMADPMSPSHCLDWSTTPCWGSGSSASVDPRPSFAGCTWLPVSSSQPGSADQVTTRTSCSRC